MSSGKTTLLIPKEVNTELVIASKLKDTTKEKLGTKILKDGLKPIMEKVIRQKFN